MIDLSFERSKCSAIINCMTDGVLVVNQNKQIVLRNAAILQCVPDCARLRLPAAMESLGSADLTDLLTEALNAGITEMIVSKEITIGPSTYMANVSPVSDAREEILGAVVVLRDITALKKLEHAKSMFVSLVAHETKAPIAAIEGFLNIILSTEIDRDCKRDRHMLERALARSRSLRAMLAELMNLTAMKVGDFIIRRSPLDVEAVLSEAVNLYQERARKKNIELSLSSENAATMGQLLADKKAMLNVFTNLVDNAIKYTLPKGHVTVHAERQGVYVEVTISDDGIGMTPEEKHRVFDEFYRAKNKHTAHVDGTGLGLALVKRLVERHNGTITVRSTPGKGSRFIVRLPVIEF